MRFALPALAPALAPSRCPPPPTQAAGTTATACLRLARIGALNRSALEAAFQHSDRDRDRRTGSHCHMAARRRQLRHARRVHRVISFVSVSCPSTGAYTKPTHTPRTSQNVSKPLQTACLHKHLGHHVRIAVAGRAAILKVSLALLGGIAANTARCATIGNAPLELVDRCRLVLAS